MGTDQPEKSAGLVSSLEDYREENGLNISQLAERLGFTRPYVSRILSGEKDPGISFRHAARALLDDGKARKDTIALPESGNRSMQIIGNERVQEHARKLMDEEYLETPEELLNWFLRQDLKRIEKEGRSHDTSGSTETVKGQHGDKVVHRAKRD